MKFRYLNNRKWSELSAVEKIVILEIAREKKELYPDPYMDIPRHKRSDYKRSKSEYDRMRNNREKHIKKLCEMRGIEYE